MTAKNKFRSLKNSLKKLTNCHVSIYFWNTQVLITVDARIHKPSANLRAIGLPSRVPADNAFECIKFPLLIACNHVNNADEPLCLSIAWSHEGPYLLRKLGKGSYTRGVGRGLNSRKLARACLIHREYRPYPVLFDASMYIQICMYTYGLSAFT